MNTGTSSLQRTTAPVNERLYAAARPVNPLRNRSFCEFLKIIRCDAPGDRLVQLIFRSEADDRRGSRRLRLRQFDAERLQPLRRDAALADRLHERRLVHW